MQELDEDLKLHTAGGDDAPDTSATEPLLPDRATPVDIANCPEEELVEAAVAKTTLPLWLCADAAE